MITGRDMQTTSEISRESNKIVQCLFSGSTSEYEILCLYDKAADKDVFVLALIGALILRHKQWQALRGREIGQAATCAGAAPTL